MNTPRLMSHCLPLSLCLILIQAAAADEPVPTDASTVLIDPHSSLLVELATDKKIASLKTRFTKNEDDHVFLVNLSGPFDESNSEATLGNLDGLASTASAELGYQKLFDRFEQHRIWSVTPSLRVGQKSYKFADDANLANDKKQDKIAFSAALAGSLFFDGPGFLSNGALAGLRVKYEKSYKAGPDMQICTPLATSGATTCRTTGAKAPEESKGTIVQGQIAVIPVKGIGVSLLLSRDIKNDITGIELPVYLASDEKTGLLTGGIKLSWESEKKETKAVLFLSHPLGTW